MGPAFEKNESFGSRSTFGPITMPRFDAVILFCCKMPPQVSTPTKQSRSTRHKERTSLKVETLTRNDTMRCSTAKLVGGSLLTRALKTGASKHTHLLSNTFLTSARARAYSAIPACSASTKCGKSSKGISGSGSRRSQSFSRPETTCSSSIAKSIGKPRSIERWMALMVSALPLMRNKPGVLTAVGGCNSS